MKNIFKIKHLLSSVVLLMPLSIYAHGDNSTDHDQSVLRQMLTTTALPNVPDHKLTSLTVELKPGVEVGAHQHDAFVFVYVLEGKLGSQLNNAEIIEYEVGDSWVELPGDEHSLTKNMSDADTAKLLVVFVAKDGAKLTTSDDIE